MRKLSVVFVALALVVGFSASAMAAQGGIPYMSAENLPVGAKTIDVYGSVRVQTYWQSIQPNVGNDNNDLVWNLDDGGSRFGVRFKSGPVGANVEIRPRDQQVANYGNFGRATLVRQWYGTYNVGFGTFLAGFTWTPTFDPICNECLVGGGGFLDGYGDGGGSARKSGLQFHMPIKPVNGLLKLALLEPATQANNGNAGSVLGVTLAGAGAAAYTDTKTTLPAFEASLAGAFGPVSFNVKGGFQTWDVRDPVTDGTESVNTYLFGLDLMYSMGPFYVRGLGYVGQNMASMGMQAPSAVGTYGFLPTLTVSATGATNMEDTTNYGYFGVLGFKFNDMIAAEAGWGQRKASQDSGVFKNKDDHTAIVLLIPISITPAFVITPEFLWTDEGKLKVNGVETDRGNTFRGGIYWRIDF